MKRRQFLKGAGLAAVGTAAVAAPAIAQSMPEIRWRVTTSFPRSLDTIHGGAETVAKYVSEATDGRFQMQVFPGGEIVPALQALDAVSNGTVEACHTCLYYYWGKDPTFAFGTAVPFGLNARQQNAWMMFGGGEQLMKALHAKYNVEVIPCGVISPEASGWFRKEIKTLDDLKGLKMRFFGLGANVMQKMGVSTQLLQGGEIFQALQMGTIDATEFSMPVMDLTLGFHQVAKFYYFPGWHQQSTINELLISKKKWAEFSETQKSIIRTVCDATMLQQFAEGEALQFGAMKEIQSKGVKLMRWPQEFIDAFEKAWVEVAAEESQKSAEFKKAWDSYSEFRKNYAVWKDLGYLK